MALKALLLLSGSGSTAVIIAPDHCRSGKHDWIWQVHACSNLASGIDPRVHPQPLLRIQLHVHLEIETFLAVLGNGLQPGQISHQSSDVVLNGCSSRIRVVDELGRLINAARVIVDVPFCRQQH